jgi:hypothetical protein
MSGPELIRLRFRVPSAYGSNPSTLEAADFSPPSDRVGHGGLCQGRVSNGGYSYRTHGCDKRANRAITGYANPSFGPLPDDAEPVTVHVCGNHDVIAKATRKAAKERAATAARDAKVNRREQHKQLLQRHADQINELAGGVAVVEVAYRPGFTAGEYSWVLQVAMPGALVEALQLRQEVPS